MSALNDRDRARTAPCINRRLDDAAAARLLPFANDVSGARVQARLAELDREWDVDRVVEIDIAITGLTGLLLARRVRPAFILLTAIAGSAGLWHAVLGGHPLLPLLRRAGLRTAHEINRERHALKALRGDFALLPPSGTASGDAKPAGGAASAAHARAMSAASRNGSDAQAREPRNGGPAASGNGPHAGHRQRSRWVAPTATRVATHTAPQLNESIRERTQASLLLALDPDRDGIPARLAELEREWDVERVLQANASTLILSGLVLGTAASRHFLWLPVAVLCFLAQHAVQGWCPPLPILRRAGVRTAGEIDRERHALKALRGDFDRVGEPGSDSAARRVHEVLQAVDC